MKKKETAKHFKYRSNADKSESLKTVVAERGQVTIPKKLRDQLGLFPGTSVQWELKDNQIYLSKDIDDISARIESVRGCIKHTFPYSSTDECMDDIRGPVE